MQNWLRRLTPTPAAWGGIVLTVAIGLATLATRPGQMWVWLGHDLPYLFKPPAVPEDLIMVYLDETSYQTLDQTPAQFDRSLHAAALRHLTRDGARMVVYDIWFGDAGDRAATAELAEAMQLHGHVAVAAIVERSRHPDLRGGSLRLPTRPIQEAAAALGVASVPVDTDGRVRRLPGPALGTESLPVAAFRLFEGGDPQPLAPMSKAPSRWLNLHGPHPTLRSLHFSDVRHQLPGYFRDKVVFIAALPATGYAQDEVDEFRTAYSRWTGQTFPGAVLLATAFTNLRDESWRERLAVGWELFWLVVTGVVLGGVASRCPPRWILLLAGTTALAAAAAGFWLFFARQSWFGWPVLALVQTPVAAGWGVLAHYRRLIRLKRGIPDHVMLKCIGRGAYGQVWLARNAVGIYHAVKILHRSEFETSDPYEREFRGIETFMPVSRSHPGFVNILHAGRNQREGYFYYIMEAADDKVRGPRIDPNRYEALTLSGLIRREGVLTLAYCLKLGRSLAQALGHLHHHGLIHRDIKPANIIYVHGEPKFADIGLVTQMARKGRDVTMVGTAAYMAPEGPGTPGADLFSLGKVLYEASTGLEPDLFPELPTGFFQGEDLEVRREFQRIVGKACDHDVTRRYADAADMEADLERLQRAVEESPDAATRRDISP